MNDWYFAYGSNLWIDQMTMRTDRIGDGENRPRRALLPNHRLVFNMRGECGGVFANIVFPGKGVLGVLYCCEPDALRRLDAFEQGYDRRRIFVTAENGDQVEAFTYIARRAHVADGHRPSAEYLLRIVTGARQHGLPEAYIRELEEEAQQEPGRL